VQNNERIDKYYLDVDKISNKGRQQAFNNCNFTSDFKNEKLYIWLTIKLLCQVGVFSGFRTV